MGFSVEEILGWTDGRIGNPTECEGFRKDCRVDRPAPLRGSGKTDLAFFFNPVWKQDLPFAAPGILITGEPFLKPLETSGLPLWKNSVVVVCKDPYLAMAELSGKFAARLSTTAHVPGEESVGRDPELPLIHPLAVIAKAAVLGAGVRIGAHCVVEDGAHIGSGSVLYPNCYVGPDAVIGEQCVLFPGVSVYEWVQIGNRVRIHAGSVLGADGFGYAPERAADGKTVVGHRKIHHLGRVIIGDDVEIGANSCVDRGTMGDTRVEKNAKLDNLVQIAHNARVDEGGVVCGGTCLAGNSSVGKYAYVGGLTGVANQAHIGDGAQVGALSLVTKDVAPGSTAVGNPQREYREHFKAHAMLSRLVAERSSKKGKQSDE